MGTRWLYSSAGRVRNLAAHHAGAKVLSIVHSNHRDAVLEAGASAFVDPDHNPPPNLTETSLVLDAIGGSLAGTVAITLGDAGRFASIVDPAVRGGPRENFFVVEPDCADLTEITSRVDEGLLRQARVEHDPPCRDSLPTGTRHTETLASGVTKWQVSCVAAASSSR
jgi:hypothetical protein